LALRQAISARLFHLASELGKSNLDMVAIQEVPVDGGGSEQNLGPKT